MEKTKVYFAIFDAGDGSSSARWFLTEQKALEAIERSVSSHSAPADGPYEVETYVGSNVYESAREAEQEAEFDEMQKDGFDLIFSYEGKEYYAYFFFDGKVASYYDPLVWKGTESLEIPFDTFLACPRYYRPSAS